MSDGGVDCDFSHRSQCNEGIRTKIIRERCEKAWLSLTMKSISISDNVNERMEGNQCGR